MRLLRRAYKPSAIHVILLLVTLINLIPIYYMIAGSFKGKTELANNPLNIPEKFTLGNYDQLLFEKNFPRLFLNSTIVTLSSVIISLAVASLASYAFARFQFRGKQFLFNFIAALMAIPVIVVIIPLFVLMSNLNLINTYPSPVIIYIGFLLPFSIFFITGFFRSIPVEIMDAAKIDGANDVQILLSILIPLSKAPMATLFIVNGLWVWNELLVAIMFLQKEEMRTLMSGIAALSGRNVRDIPLILAASVLSCAPMALILIAGQQTFVKGLTAGAVK
jgi:raffinose/stachyose/melibiose transport system permease protein